MNKQSTYSLPEEFGCRIRQQFGEESNDFLNSLEQGAATSVRINPRKFSFRGDKLQSVPWCPSGFFLDERPVFTLDPLLHAGAYYVQESSSMFLEQVFRATESHRPRLVLDLCGAPGGKSTHLLSLLGDDDLLVTNEVIQSRVKILQENVRKWGAHNVAICNNDPKDFQRLNGFFDLVVVDAPCSGEGLFRRDGAARAEWSPDNARLCSVRQRRILTDIWPSLKTSGYMIYSTCTFNPEENEENLKWLQEQAGFESIRINLQAEWKVEEVENNGVFAYRFLPHRVKGEGFFIALLRKTETQTAFRFPKKGRPGADKLPSALLPVKNWVAPGNFDFLFHRDTAVLFPQQWNDELKAVQQFLKVVDFGLPIAELKGKNIAPNHFLSLSPLLKNGSFETTTLELDEALKFLRKEEVKAESCNPGWQLACFRGVPLGFIKNIGNRANNYFPTEWRIRMQVAQAGKLWHGE